MPNPRSRKSLCLACLTCVIWCGLSFPAQAMSLTIQASEVTENYTFQIGDHRFGVWEELLVEQGLQFSAPDSYELTRTTIFEFGWFSLRIPCRFSLLMTILGSALVFVCSLFLIRKARRRKKLAGDSV